MKLKIIIGACALLAFVGILVGTFCCRGDSDYQPIDDSSNSDFERRLVREVQHLVPAPKRRLLPPVLDPLFDAILNHQFIYEFCPKDFGEHPCESILTSSKAIEATEGYLCPKSGYCVLTNILSPPVSMAALFGNSSGWVFCSEYPSRTCQSFGRQQFPQSALSGFFKSDSGGRLGVLTSYKKHPSTTKYARKNHSESLVKPPASRSRDLNPSYGRRMIWIERITHYLPFVTIILNAPLIIWSIVWLTRRTTPHFGTLNKFQQAAVLWNTSVFIWMAVILICEPFPLVVTMNLLSLMVPFMALWGVSIFILCLIEYRVIYPENEPTDEDELDQGQTTLPRPVK
ncbi:Hypothetical protein NTJ_12734 [Nesidiocoris tenuis]|uniref:Uncharacterized protein n=1 Tax=Nesidiocoris tenuis TaxID=355587 RepID=A0ABN7B8D8_9HEMI|nr:Hypothetical protein NTJ_12734 [Nesidiocoris tenuis]